MFDGATSVNVANGPGTVQGNGSTLMMNCDMGSCSVVKVGFNPFNQAGSGDGYPLKDIWSAEADDGNILTIAYFVLPTRSMLNVDFNYSGNGTVTLAVVVDSNSPGINIPTGNVADLVLPPGQTVAFYPVVTGQVDSITISYSIAGLLDH